MELFCFKVGVVFFSCTGRINLGRAGISEQV